VGVTLGVTAFGRIHFRAKNGRLITLNVKATGPRFQDDSGRFMTFRKNVIFVVVDESARLLALVNAL
jgi:hypothetical protein